MSSVRVDYAAGVELAMEHLLRLEHRRIAFLSGPLKLTSARLRAEAFMCCLKRHGALGQPNLLQQGDHRVEGGRAAMQRVLDKGKHPTAVLASNDLTAIGALGAIRHAGLRIPEDISVIGFDGIELSAYTEPSLTTLQISRREIAVTAFRSLYQTGKRDGKNEHVIQPQLVIRQSTVPVPVPGKPR